MDHKMGSQTRSLGNPNGSQGLSQGPLGPVQASISTDFGTILHDFLMISRIMWVTFYLVCLISVFGHLELPFSNFWSQVLMCWGRRQGLLRSQTNSMWPTFCLACLFVFVTSSPTFQVSGHRFSGSSVELLANSGRRHGGGKAESKWIMMRSFLAIDFSGSSVELLANCGRRHGGGNAEGN